MTQKSFNLSVCVIFLVVSILQLERILQGWAVLIGDWRVPIWFSAIAFVVSGSLSVLGFMMYRSASSDGGQDAK